MSNIAIITARGGSKRIPRKNIKNFMGQPMICYAIEAALNSGIFEEVMVSTEDIEIAEISQKNGAKVPFMRSSATASDFATTYEVLDEVLSEYKKLGKEFDTLCCIYPCVPFLRSETLKKAYETIGSNDGVLPVCKYPVPIEWAMELNKNQILIPNNRDAQKIRSQDIVPKYYDVGMFYFCRTQKMYETQSLVTEKTVGYLMSEAECQDIDNESDWKMAEMKYKIMHNL